MSTLTTIQAADLITDSRADINDNFSALNTDKMETSVLDTDTTLAANSDAKIPSQKAVKSYVDAGGNVNASETNKGIVEEATDAEVTAGTATGGTGAKLFVTPTKLATHLSTLAYSKVSFDGLTDTDANFTSATEAAILTASLAGGALGTNKIIRGRVYVTNWQTDDETVRLTLRLKYGATTICTAVIDATSTVSANTLNGYIDFVVMGDGTTSAQTGLIHLFLSEKTLDPLNASNGCNHIVSGTATEDSTTTLTLQLTADWDVGGAGRVLSTSIAYMEVVR